MHQHQQTDRRPRQRPPRDPLDALPRDSVKGEKTQQRAEQLREEQDRHDQQRHRQQRDQRQTKGLALPGARVDQRVEQQAGEQRRQPDHQQAQRMAVEHRWRQPRAAQHLPGHVRRRPVDQRHEHAHRRREQRRHADVVHRADDAVWQRPDVQSRLETTAGDQRFGRPVVVGDVEIEVERDRVRDREVVRLVTGAGERAVGDQPPQREPDDDAEDLTETGCAPNGNGGQRQSVGIQRRALSTANFQLPTANQLPTSNFQLPARSNSRVKDHGLTHSTGPSPRLFELLRLAVGRWKFVGSWRLVVGVYVRAGGVAAALRPSSP